MRIGACRTFLLLSIAATSIAAQTNTIVPTTNTRRVAIPTSTTAGQAVTTTFQQGNATGQQTSTVTFANPLRIETPATPPALKERWWQTPAATAALIVALSALLNSLILMSFNVSSLRQKEREIQLVNRQKDIEEERRSIYKQLNEFYGPMQQLFAVNKDIADAFYNGPRFRTLLRLLDGAVFKGNDAALLREILQVNDEIEKLIMTKSGLVDDVELRNALSRQASHIRILRLASSGALTGDKERFRKYVFPGKKAADAPETGQLPDQPGDDKAVRPVEQRIDVEARIDEHIDTLRRRLQELNSSGMTPEAGGRS
jgi:hypothetical protein